jgi:hypothetical protein
LPYAFNTGGFQALSKGRDYLTIQKRLGESGEYAHTLQLVDVASGWSERMVLLNRGQAAMEGGFRTALARLPFALVELHPDNGREFFNDHLKRLFPQLVPGLTLSRSRPYHKNDNRFVEVRRFGACEIASKMQEVENTITS